MFKKYTKLIFSGLAVAIIFFNFLIFTLAGQAGTQTDIQNQMNKTGTRAGWVAVTNTSMAQILQTVISAFLGLLGIIFIVLIIYAGFNWMTAQGQEEKVTLAKETLMRAAIGLIIIVAAYSITYFVFNSLPGGGNSASGG